MMGIMDLFRLPWLHPELSAMMELFSYHGYTHIYRVAVGNDGNYGLIQVTMVTSRAVGNDGIIQLPWIHPYIPGSCRQ